MIVWRVKRRLAARSEINEVTTRIFQIDLPEGPEELEEPNEQWNLMKPLRLPTYRETVERFNSDPPSYDEPEGTEETPGYSEQQVESAL